MRNRQVMKLLAGFRKFREKYFLAEGSVYSSAGQAPKTLVIACSDSRVDPALMASASPGELFVVRNVANLVPPFEVATKGLHGVSAAIEFAVVNLKVETIVILGHRQCGGIQALIQGVDNKDSFIGPWMKIANPARQKVISENPEADIETLCKLCEKESIAVSLANLKTFPFIQQAINDRNLQLIGVYFDLELGHLLEYDELKGTYRMLTEESH